jgi:hypothetical protein
MKHVRQHCPQAQPMWSREQVTLALRRLVAERMKGAMGQGVEITRQVI